MPLTWRNVDTPDFRASMQGYETFSNLLGRAFSGAEQGLDRFDASQDKRVNSEIAMNLLKFQDPAAYKTALASGTVFAGMDPRRISAGTIAAAGARSTDLLNQAVGEQNLAIGKYGFDKTQRLDAADQAAAPLVMDRSLAYAAGKGAEWDAAHPDFGKGLTVSNITSLFKGGQEARLGALDITGKGLTNEGSALQNERGRFDFGVAKEDRATFLSGQAALNDLAQGPGFDRESAMAWVNAQNYSPQVKNALRAQIDGQYGSPASGMIAGAVGGGGAGGDPTRVITSGGAGNLGIGSLPDNIKTLGQASEFAKTLNAQGQESSAMGVYQIVGKTLRGYAPKVLGKDWQNAPLNFENQDKIAEAIFNDHRGSAQALRQQWTSIKSDAQAEAIRRMPWEQARVVIARGESGADPRTLALGNAITDQGMRNANQARNNSITTKYAKSSQDFAPVADVANSLAGEPSFKSMGVEKIGQRIQDIMSKAQAQGTQITPRVAADILKENAKFNGDSWWYRPIGEDPISFNSKGIDAELARLKKGGYDDAIVANAAAGISQEAKDAAASKYAAAQQRYAQAQAAINQGKPVDMRPIISNLTIAEAAYKATQGAIRDDPNMSRIYGETSGPAPRPAQPVAKARPVADPARPIFIPGQGNGVRTGRLTPEQQQIQDMLLQRYSGRTF